jgi:hypothetical protein
MEVFMDTKELELERNGNKPRCRLIEADSDVFSIISSVSKALKRNGQPNLSREFIERAFASKLYNEVLVLITEYVELTGDED